jgi:hypothetical protein
MLSGYGFRFASLQFYEGPAMAAQTPAFSEESALSLAMAVVASSPAPLLLLDSALNIIAVSASFSNTFEIDPASAPDCPLASLGAGEWNTPPLRSLLIATVSGAAEIEAFEMYLERPGRDARPLVVHAQLLIY